MNSAPRGKLERSVSGIAICDITADVVVMGAGGSLDIVVAGEPKPIPPAIVLGELFGERPTVDLGSPPSILGTGLEWPPSARVTKNGSARFPIALAWPLLEHKGDAPWKWRRTAERVERSQPANAIGDSVVGALKSAVVINEEQDVTLVVPNALSIDSQDDLLRALHVRGVEAHLLWRPIAASLVWVDKYGDALLKRHDQDDAPIGTVGVVHLGLDAFEITLLELMPVSVRGQRYLLPARRLASFPTLHGGGLRWAEYLAEHATAEYPDDGSAAWNLLWTTDWLGQLLKRLSRAQTDQRPAPPTFPLHGRDVLNRGVEGWRSLVSDLPDSDSDRQGEGPGAPTGSSLRKTFAPIVGPYRQAALAQSADETAFHSWLAQIKRLAGGELPVMGLVATGAFAAARLGGKTLADFALMAVCGNALTQDTIVEGRDDASGQILARGGAVYGHRRARRVPTYLDMLPRLELIIVRGGEPVWADLLETQGRYVRGGEELVAEPHNLQLHVAQGETELKLSVWQEGHDTVREVEVTFPQPVPSNTRVRLDIRIVPGQGNPRIEVKPEARLAFGGRRVYLDWRRAKDSGLAQLEALVEVLRTNPPLEPRLASLIAWQGGLWGFNYSWEGSRGAIQRLLDNFEGLPVSRLMPRLREIQNALRQNDPDYVTRQVPEHATAVSSEGKLHPDALDAELLTALTEMLDGILGQPRYEEAQPQTLRILGSCSARTPRLMEVLRQCLAWPGMIEQYHLWAFGNCLREPDDIRSFANAMLNNLSSKPPKAPNDWMRAMSRIAKYQENGMELVESQLCLGLSKYCLAVMQDQMSRGALHIKSRHASECIAYLLRRRRFDAGYLEPSSQLAENIKATFRGAIDEYTEGRLRVLGGFVNVPRVMQMMIDYINLRGRGRLIGLSSN